MVFDDNLLYEIKHRLIDEVTITSEHNHSGFHVRRGKLSPDLVIFYLEEIVGWQLPGTNPTRTYAISLWPQGAVINMRGQERHYEMELCDRSTTEGCGWLDWA